jgi:GNAT superfamily N-acetyltransferase
VVFWRSLNPFDKSLTNSSDALATEDRKTHPRSAWFRAEWKRVPEALKWRDPLRILLLAARELLRPFIFCYACEVVENDLLKPLRAPCGSRTFRVQVYDNPSQLQEVTSIVLPMGELSRDEIGRRYGQGDLVAIAYAGDEAVGYTWSALSSGMELVSGITWVVHANEAVYYGSYVRPRWRGHGIHSWLDYEMNCYARAHGMMRTLGSISLLNSGSLSLAKRQGKPKVMTIFLLQIRGLNWTYRRVRGEPLSAHFEVQSKNR